MKKIIYFLLILSSFDLFAKNCKVFSKFDLKKIQELIIQKQNDHHFSRLAIAAAFYSKEFSNSLSAYNTRVSQTSKSISKKNVKHIASEIYGTIDRSFFKDKEKYDFLNLAIRVITGKNYLRFLQRPHQDMIKNEYLFNKSNVDLANYLANNKVPLKFQNIVNHFRKCSPKLNASFSLNIFDYPNSTDIATFETSTLLKNDLNALKGILQNITQPSLSLIAELNRKTSF